MSRIPVVTTTPLGPATPCVRHGILVKSLGGVQWHLPLLSRLMKARHEGVTQSQGVLQCRQPGFYQVRLTPTLIHIKSHLFPNWHVAWRSQPQMPVSKSEPATVPETP